MEHGIVYYYEPQTPINGTITGMAPPGRETGFYYIPVANLPFRATARELKEFVETVSPVEQIEIHESTTSAHVVVKGKRNFDRALKLLDGGGEFFGRYLLADGRNETEAVVVKMHVDVGPESEGPWDQPAWACAAPPPHDATFMAMHASTWQNPSQYAAPPPPHDAYTSSMMAQAPQGYEDWLAAPAGAQYSTSAAMGSVSAHIPGGMVQYPSPAGPSSGQPSSGQQSRRIIVKNIPNWFTQQNFLDFFCEKAGFAFGELEKIDLPGAPGNNRGYALVMLASTEAAGRVIEALHNYQVEQRYLKATYAREDHIAHQATQGSRSYSSHQPSSQRPPRGSQHAHRDQHERHQGDNRATRRSRARDIVIADGSNQGSQNSHRARHARHERQEGHPDIVIAHGSNPLYRPNT